MNPAWAVDELLESILGCWSCITGCDVGGLRSGPFSSDESPLSHLVFERWDLLRLLFRACFCGVVSRGRGRAAAESESRDEDEVNSESDSVVEEAELAMVAACGGPFERGDNAGRTANSGVDAPGSTLERGPISGDMLKGADGSWWLPGAPWGRADGMFANECGRTWHGWVGQRNGYLAECGL